MKTWAFAVAALAVAAPVAAWMAAPDAPLRAHLANDAGREADLRVLVDGTVVFEGVIPGSGDVIPHVVQRDAGNPWFFATVRVESEALGIEMDERVRVWDARHLVVVLFEGKASVHATGAPPMWA